MAMAQKVKGDNWRAPRNDGKYPWHKWLDGDTWRIFWGEDYHVEDKSMKRTILRAAKSRGLQVTIRSKVPGQVTFRALRDQGIVPDELGNLRQLKKRVG